MYVYVYDVYGRAGGRAGPELPTSLLRARAALLYGREALMGRASLRGGLTDGPEALSGRLLMSPILRAGDAYGTSLLIAGRAYGSLLTGRSRRRLSCEASCKSA